MTLYRKYRPQTLAEVTGQDHIVKVLQAAIEQQRLAHAYMFAGPRGTGKTSVARILAKAVNCLGQETGGGRREAGKPGQVPCNECAHCVAIDKGAFLDVVEIDAASNGRVEEARQLIDQVATAPAMGGYKVYILDEVHMLSTAAFNALLKTLEEPPSKVIFILCTTEVHKVPVTILSRCQRLQFNRASLDNTSQQIKKIAEAESIKVEDSAVWLLAELADGGYRDALMLLEQLSLSEGKKGASLTRQQLVEQLGLANEVVVDQISQAIAENNGQTALDSVQSFMSQGGAIGNLVQALVGQWRVVMTAGLDPKLAESLYGQERTKAAVALQVPASRAAQVLERLMKIQASSVSGELMLEVALVDLTSQSDVKSGDRRQETGDPSTSSGQAKRQETGGEVHTKGEGGREKAAIDKGKTQPPASSLQPPAESEPLPQPPVEVIEAVNQPVQTAKPVPAGAPAELLEAWQKILSELNVQSRSLAAILRDCTPLSYDGTMLLLQFWYEFHKKQLELDKNRKLLEKVASEVLGQPVKVRGQLGDVAKRPRRRAMSEEDIHNVEPVEQDASELLDAASKIFGGEIV